MFAKNFRKRRFSGLNKKGDLTSCKRSLPVDFVLFVHCCIILLYKHFSRKFDDCQEKRETLGRIQNRDFLQANFMYNNEAIQVLHTLLTIS